MLYLGFALKTFKLVIIIFNFSYFLGMLWYIASDIIERAVVAYRESNPYDGPVNDNFFLKDHELDCHVRDC